MSDFELKFHFDFAFWRRFAISGPLSMVHRHAVNLSHSWESKLIIYTIQFVTRRRHAKSNCLYRPPTSLLLLLSVVVLVIIKFNTYFNHIQSRTLPSIPYSSDLTPPFSNIPDSLILSILTYTANRTQRNSLLPYLASVSSLVSMSKLFAWCQCVHLYM